MQSLSLHQPVSASLRVSHPGFVNSQHPAAFSLPSAASKYTFLLSLYDAVPESEVPASDFPNLVPAVRLVFLSVPPPFSMLSAVLTGTGESVLSSDFFVATPSDFLHSFLQSRMPSLCIFLPSIFS